MTQAVLDEKAEKAERKAALKAREAEIAAKETALNVGKTGKGTRTMIGLTKGKNPRMVEYESFDEKQKDTLPTTLTEFMQLAKVEDESVIVGFIISGYNDKSFENAADESNEFVESSWDADVQKQFKAILKNYSAALNVSIEDASAAIKPNFVKGLASVFSNRLGPVGSQQSK